MSEWLSRRVPFLRALKAPSAYQRVLLELLDKPDRSPEEERKLKALIRAEQADERAQKARGEVAKVLNAEKAAARKARTHRLIELGALFELAGLDQEDRGALLGALLGMAKVEERERWKQWKTAGDALLAERAKR